MNITEQQKEKIMPIVIILLSVGVVMGQIAETRPGFPFEMPDLLRSIIDPIQYFVGFLLISLIFVVISVKKHEQIPNPLLERLKWYFSLLLINNFIILIFKVLQKTNIISLRNGFSGIGKFYLILGAVRSITNLTLISVASCILIYGLTKYTLAKEPSTPVWTKLGKGMAALVFFNWLTSVPVNLTSFLTNRSIFVWSLSFSQIGNVILAVMFYWVVKELQVKYRTKFFRYLTSYFGLALLMAVLNLAYSMGSYGLMQRFPAGETELLGGFGQFVLYVSFLIGVILNFLMYQSISHYSEFPENAVYENVDQINQEEFAAVEESFSQNT